MRCGAGASTWCRRMSSTTRRRGWRTGWSGRRGCFMARTSALAVVALAVTVASLFVGDTWIAPREVGEALLGRGAANTIIIVRDLRLPRALLAFVVGAALAGSGTVFQGLFRNPLADPFVVGISGGAALGAVAAIVAGVQVSVLGLGAVTLAAFAGALG